MLDELKLRYKETSIAKRLVLCAFVALLPALFLYLDESGDVDDKFDAAELAEKNAAAELLKADNQLKNLSKTEGELEFTRDQLKKAEARLPDNVAIDEVLRTIGKTAKDAGILLDLFEPKEEVVKGGEYKFVEIPVKITILSRDYSKICEWVDSVAGLKSRIYLKAWSINRKKMSDNLDDTEKRELYTIKMSGNESMEEEFRGRIDRDRFRLEFSGEFSLFKLATASQIAAAEAAERAEEAEKAKTPGYRPAPPKDGETKKPDVHSDSGRPPQNRENGGPA